MYYPLIPRARCLKTGKKKKKADVFSACIHLGSLSVSLQVLLTHHKEVVKTHLHFVCRLPVTALEAVFWKISSVSWKQLSASWKHDT